MMLETYGQWPAVSIRASRAGGDGVTRTSPRASGQFQSAPPAREATVCDPEGPV